MTGRTHVARVITLVAVAGLAAGLLAPLARAEDQPQRVPGENERAKLAPIVMQNYRPHDARGINMFETPKLDNVPYNGFQLNWGGSFSQEFQALHHTNTATPVISGTPPVNQNQLLKIGSGFNNAMASMYLDAQLAKNIRVEMTSYLSTRHHNETWVKDGFLLIDGSPWENATLDNLMKYLTLRIGHFEVNYGDAHFRSRDQRAPSYLGKIGFDRQLNPDLRLRLTGSIYSTAKSISNTLYSGSRAG